MYAATELCKDFWRFVRRCAYDDGNDYLTSADGSIGMVFQDRRRRAVYLQPGDTRIDEPLDIRDPRPMVYQTIQEALLDFLIFRVDGAWYDGVPDFLDWLRAQALIMAQVAREPQWLTVQTPVMGDDMKWSPDRLTTHAMAIAPGEWDTLSHETFDAIVRQYYRSEEDGPRPLLTP